MSAPTADPPGVIAQVTVEPLNGGALLARVGTTAEGAAIVFEGRVRSENKGRTVVRLHYEAYDAMAEGVLREIGSEALALHPISQVAVAHRTGTLEPGDVSLVVGVAAAHRDPALNAVRYVIEQLKARLPIWKREEYEDGSASWLPGRPGAARDAAGEPPGSGRAGT